MLSEPNNKVDEMVNAGLQNTQYAGTENKTQKCQKMSNKIDAEVQNNNVKIQKLMLK